MSDHTIFLTDDILIEILTKLPLKCIYRNKCVSKSWQKLISDQYFSTKIPLILSCIFYRNSFNNLKLEPRFGFISNNNFNEKDFNFLPFHHNSSIIDCSNGLLLFYSSFPSAFHVCNPIAKTWFSLPKQRNKSQLSILAFDPSKSNFYKVVCFCGWEEKGGRIEVFSSDNAKWVEHSINWGVETIKLSASMHYFDGFLYILAYSRKIVCINLEEICCRVIELPEKIKNDVFLGNSCGFLQFAINDENELRIWVYDGLYWVLRNKVCVLEILRWNGEEKSFCNGFLHNGVFNFLGFHPREEVVYVWVKGKLVYYDLCRKKFGLVCELGAEEEKIQVIQISMFSYLDNVLNC